MSTGPPPSLGNLLDIADSSDAALRELLRASHDTDTLSGPHLTPERPAKTPRTPGDEETLEWHEVIELQAFSERKAWIEEKIKFLEQLPPIQVFVGLDAVRSSALDVPGLPTREQLREWQEEHDRIEKETEVFDNGELQKLKKFTKAATQRNLSPADTDLIEITLTTIYALDKLVHLLRDRSDNLELLAIRLTWEERRKTSWTELRSLQAELQKFLETRARWSPSVYERDEDDEREKPAPDRLALPQPTLRRRGSAVSLASAASDASIPSLGISRGERFKLAELLSRDAAQFASRASSLRHSKIAAAGKALDKLIDESRKPVPDELLDEQDRLEDKGINEMEDIGKFIMNVVMQWKKADEIYVETVKDKNAAQTLLEEIEIAKLHHPTSRQNASFMSRTAALTKRLEMRGNPSAPNSTFPRPYHALYPDQEAANREIAQILTSEIVSAGFHVREVETAAKEYHAMFDAVKKVETITKTASELASQLESLVTRLESGVESAKGDGLPPNLDTEACLQESSHAAFLALLPDVMDQLGKVETTADDLLTTAQRALADLRYPGIDEGFIQNSTVVVDRLSTIRSSSAAARDTALTKVDVLNQVRRIWSTMAEVFDQLNNIREDIAETMQQRAWKPESEVDAAILTPESPASVLPSTNSPPTALSQRLDTLQDTLKDSIVFPLDAVLPSLGPSFREYLNSCVSGLKAALHDARRLAGLCAAVERQATEMESIRDEANRLQLRAEELRTRCESCGHDVLSGSLAGDELMSTLDVFNSELSQIHEDSQSFQDSLSRRVPFVAAIDKAPVSHTAPSHAKRFSISTGLNLEVVRQAASTGVPIDLLSLDRAARSDSNRFSMQVAGEVDSLTQGVDYLRWCELARRIEVETKSASKGLQEAANAMEALQKSVEEAATKQRSLEDLATLSEQIDILTQKHGPSITSTSATLRDLLSQLETGLASHDHAASSSLISPRRRSVEDIRQQSETWRENMEVLSERVSDLQHLEQVRLMEEERARAEEERLREEAEARAEQERLEAERRAAEEAEAHAKAEEERVRLEMEKEAEREREQLALEAAEAERKLAEQRKQALDDSEDVFGMDGLPNAGSIMSPELSDLHSLISSLKKRLRSINITEVAHAGHRGTTSLPSSEKATSLEKSFTALLDEVNTLPPSVPESAVVDADLQSLRSEVQTNSDLLRKVHQLVGLATAIQHCDNALSDLLEHIDSYPAPPAGPLSSSHDSDTRQPPEDQMSARLTFTKRLVDDVVARAEPLADDARVVPEKDRISQTWEELNAMGLDRVIGQKSRPGSVISTSGRTSRGAATPAPVPGPKRPSTGRSSMSGPASSSKFLAPPPARARRSVSGNSTLSTGSHTRSSSRASNASTQRSVSGPISISTANTTSRLYTTTFASRQRSSSVTSNAGTPTEKRGTPVLPSTPQSVTTRPRARTNQNMPTPVRTASPALSEMPRSRSSLNMSRSSVGSASKSTWSRAPRPSFPHVPKSSPPQPKPVTKEKKPYVPNPKNKLDVAVGDVVNRLPVNISIEVVADTWKDQSGKYWIGDDDPKLCFCRILRSQTVMVRVGGGWTELSKFIKEHFADAFRLLPESPKRFSPKRLGSTEEKWISSATLQHASIAEVMRSPPMHPTTPEPGSSFVPSFALSTPSGTSPKSMKSSSPGSPLQPIQFIRRADRDSPMLRADTPTKPLRPSSVAHTPRQPAWRP